MVQEKKYGDVSHFSCIDKKKEKIRSKTGVRFSFCISVVRAKTKIFFTFCDLKEKSYTVVESSVQNKSRSIHVSDYEYY